MTWRLDDDTIDREVPCASVGLLRQEMPDGTEVPVDSAMRSRECAGVIPAGEPHHVEQGWGDEGLRFCRHCVRKMNDAELAVRDRAVLVKVELTYGDGSVRRLEGDAAGDWEEMTESAGVVAGVHGAEGRELPWVEIAPKGAK